MEDLVKKIREESCHLLGSMIDGKYAKIIDVSSELDGWDLFFAVHGSFIKNIYDPIIGNGVLKNPSNSEASYSKDFTLKQLTERLAKVLEMQKSEVVKLLPGLLNQGFPWRDESGRYYVCFEPCFIDKRKKKKYTLKIKKVAYRTRSPHGLGGCL